MDLIIAYVVFRSHANSSGHDDMPNQSLLLAPAAG